MAAGREGMKRGADGGGWGVEVRERLDHVHAWEGEVRRRERDDGREEVSSVRGGGSQGGPRAGGRLVGATTPLWAPL